MMSRVTDTKRLLDGDLHARAAELLGFLAQAADDGDAHPVDPQEAIDVMIVAMATIIEADDTVLSPRDFRQTAEHYGSELMTLARTLRKWGESDGKRHIERMGGYSSDTPGRKLGPSN